MRNEEDKAKVELSIFEKFVEVSGISVKSDSVRKGNADQGEPDIYCEMEEGVVYFELAEACAPEFAAAISRSLKSGKSEAVWGGDVSIETIRKKRKKTYKVSEPIELILYVAGRTALPDDVLVPQLKPVLSKDLGPFRRVWLFGDEIHCLANNS